MLIKLRLATPQDADALLEIYAPYVKQTAISFEYDVPSAAEFAERIEQTLHRYPYLLAYVSDEAACANDERNGNFKISASAAGAGNEILPADEARNCASGAAKQNSANLIVAVKQSGANLKHGQILGYAYASAFKERAAYDWSTESSVYVSQNVRALGIGRLLYEALQRTLKAQNIVDMNACIAYGDDEYLNGASVRFHERMGFRFVGRFERCAYKFGRWYDMAWMQKPIGEHLQNQPAMRPFARFRDEICASAGIEI
ncbi:GNAT family N-acetyltransferase [uncultured Campylobacter sp.]|uniref:GNAT family N-acetyltransferase n=1 Tax=uncultured Campylobacter sp. TaxID=218934 RepID=UPI00260A0C5F|nr:GNAT family N-acetyltransferase [uncultured Campylobacter sp.]